MSYGRRTVRLSPRDRRALRMGAVLAGPALVYALAVRPYLASLGSARSILSAQRDLLARERALVAAPLIPKQAVAVREAVAHSRERLYAEPDPIAATAALSREVAQAFDDAGIALQHTEAREPVKQPDGMRELTIDLRAEGDFEGILYMLSLLEAGDHLIRVSRFGIERGPTQPGDKNEAEALAIVATVHGYMQ